MGTIGALVFLAIIIIFIMKARGDRRGKLPCILFLHLFIFYLVLSDEMCEFAMDFHYENISAVQDLN